MKIVYTAVDRLAGGTSCLVSGHTAGTQYTLYTDAERIDAVDATKRTDNASIDGTLEVLLDEIAEGWKITSGHVAQADQDDWREFLASVAAGESFTLDVYGDASTTVDEQTVVLVGKWSKSRVYAQVMQYSFEVKVTG